MSMTRDTGPSLRDVGLGFFFFFLFSFSASAQFKPEEMMKPYAYTNEAGEVFMCQLWAPQFPEQGKKYPLILFLHGSGECGKDNELHTRVGLPSLLKQLVLQPEQAIVLAPQCQVGNWWVKSLAMRPDYHAAKEPTASLDVALELCKHLVKTKQADPDRLYITGLSLGGFGTWDAIQRDPSFFAAAVPICGGGDPRFASSLSSIPIWVFHGRDDKNVHPDCSRRMARAIKDVGGTIVYTEYEGGSHAIWDRAYSEKDLIPWLLKQTRVKKPWWKFW
jgi:predicted peptidase